MGWRVIIVSLFLVLIRFFWIGILQHNTCPVCRSPLTSEAVNQARETAAVDAQSTAAQDLAENEFEMD